MLNPRMEKALNEQINAELYSAYLYLSMAGWFETQNFKGMGHWMRIQALEEEVHAMKFFVFINERMGKVTLTGIEGPKTKWKSALEAFEDAFKHETTVTARINNLVDIAITEKDHAANAFLQWFVNEQVEEESNARGIADKLKLIGTNTALQLMLDQELAVRAFVPPVPPLF